MLTSWAYSTTAAQTKIRLEKQAYLRLLRMQFFINDLLCFRFFPTVRWANTSQPATAQSSTIWRGNDSLMKPHNNSRAFTINSFFLCACIMQHSDKKNTVGVRVYAPRFPYQTVRWPDSVTSTDLAKSCCNCFWKKMQRASHRLRRDMTSIYWLRCCANAAKSSKHSTSLDEISIALWLRKTLCGEYIKKIWTQQ